MQRTLIILLLTCSGIGACGRSPSTSHTKSFELTDKSGQRWLLEFKDLFVDRKECLTVDCETTTSVQRLPIAMYDFRLQGAFGVQMHYQGPEGAAYLEKQRTSLERTLNDPDIRPESQEGVRQTLNFVKEQINLRAEADLSIADLLSNQVRQIGENEGPTFEKLQTPFEDRLGGACDIENVFVNATFDTKLVWMPVEVPAANWFDANEVPRRQDHLGGDGERAPKPAYSCKHILGRAWRAPTLAEVKAAVNSGIRRHNSYMSTNQCWKQFWTSDSKQYQTGITYGISTNLSTMLGNETSRWDQHSIICVASYDAEVANVKARYAASLNH